MADEIYCYPDSNVLMNRMGIQNPEQLNKAEKQLTMLRILELLEHPVKGSFDLKHLQSIFFMHFIPLVDHALCG